MIGLKKYLKDWFRRKEEVLPGFTYFAAAFWMMAFYTPLMTSRLLGEYAKVVDLAVLTTGVIAFGTIYREEFWEAYQKSKETAGETA